LDTYGDVAGQNPQAMMTLKRLGKEYKWSVQKGGEKEILNTPNSLDKKTEKIPLQQEGLNLKQCLSNKPTHCCEKKKYNGTKGRR
jgi:hypothetical protein